MFSKSSSDVSKTEAKKPTTAPATPAKPVPATPVAAEAAKGKPPASILSADLLIKGNLKTTGDIQIMGTVEGDIRAHLLTIGEGATVKGEVIADDVVVNGNVIGRRTGPEGSSKFISTCRRRYYPQNHRN